MDCILVSKKLLKLALWGKRYMYMYVIQYNSWWWWWWLGGGNYSAIALKRMLNNIFANIF